MHALGVRIPFSENKGSKHFPIAQTEVHKKTHVVKTDVVALEWIVHSPDLKPTKHFWDELNREHWLHARPCYAASVINPFYGWMSTNSHNHVPKSSKKLSQEGYYNRACKGPLSNVQWAQECISRVSTHFSKCSLTINTCQGCLGQTGTWWYRITQG